MYFQDFFGEESTNIIEKKFFILERKKLYIFFTKNYIGFILSNQHAILNTLYTLHIP